MLPGILRAWLISFLLLSLDTYAQEPLVIDLGKSRETISLDNAYQWGDFKYSPSRDSLHLLDLRPVGMEAPMTRDNFTNSFVFSFSINNPLTRADTLIFHPGVRQAIEVFLFDTLSRSLQSVNEMRPFRTILSLEESFFHRLIIPASSFIKVYVITKFHFYTWPYWDPVLYKESSIGDKDLFYYAPVDIRALFTSFIMMGILIAILAYTLILYYQYRQREYLLYFAYVFFLLCYFLYLALGYMSFDRPYHSLGMFIPPFTQTLSHLIYFIFVKRILDLKTTLPFFNKIINGVIGILFAYLIFHTSISFGDTNVGLSAMGFFYVRIFLCLFSFYGIVVLYRSRIPLSGYIATGVLFLTVLGLASIVLSMMVDPHHPVIVYIGGSITPFKLGIIIELFIFLVAITRKSKMEMITRIRTIEFLRIENQKKELEKNMIALETQTMERKRISSEMHDDIGSGLTSIQFLSNTLSGNSGESQRQTVEKITHTSRELMDKMNEIVWSLNQDFDTLEDTIAYIRNTVSEMLENAGINFEFQVPNEVKELKLGGIIRRNIYLVVKEATHNIIKHSGADLVQYTVNLGEGLLITIKDNGGGFHPRNNQFGNGIKNMHQRMKDSGGNLEIRNEGGTTIVIFVPLTVNLSYDTINKEPD